MPQLAFNPVLISFEFYHLFDRADHGNNVGNGENAGNQHHVLFLQNFLPLSKTNL